MTGFYHPRKESGLRKPAILGLTATPSLRENIKDMTSLEAALDSICITPTVHRAELMKHVRQPRIQVLRHASSEISAFGITALFAEFAKLDINRDPCVLRLRGNPTERNIRALEKVLDKSDTFVQNQVKGLLNRATEIAEQLGTWAAEHYLWSTTRSFLGRLTENKNRFWHNWVDDEKQYLAHFLRSVRLQEPRDVPQSESQVSPKAIALIEKLASEENSVVGLVFVQNRAVVRSLKYLLNTCPLINTRHRIGTVVGSSSFQGRKSSLYEPPDESGQAAIHDFRTGRINILIATSVLEEGIDVPACNLVICFDPPSTPKSFIQRRGRARMHGSTLSFLSETSSPLIQKWQAMEEEMKAMYEDTKREIRQMQRLETVEEAKQASFEVESTNARLDHDNAKAHLEHFCSTFAAKEFVDSRPDYIIHRHGESTSPMIRATVILPLFIPAEIRQIHGAATWRSEKNATKDAAFQAYMALYKEGLVNDHLLPFKYSEIPDAETAAAIGEVEALRDPWLDVAAAWHLQGPAWRYSLELHDGGFKTVFDITLPEHLRYWRSMRVEFGENECGEIKYRSHEAIPAAAAKSAPDLTTGLLALHFSHRWPVEEQQHVIKLVVGDVDISSNGIGCRQFDPHDETLLQGQFLIRDESRIPYRFLKLLQRKPLVGQVQSVPLAYESAPEDVPYLAVRKWTKRSDFLHTIHSKAQQHKTSKPYPHVIPLSSATVDALPLQYTRLGMLIPSILHEIEVMLIAKKLSETLLRPIGLTRLDLVREAISSRSAQEPVNYERLEILGDTVLKYCTAIQVSAAKPSWPEGYLSSLKDRFVSNSRLSRAATEAGLAKFILLDSFTGLKWRPIYLKKLRMPRYRGEGKPQDIFKDFG